MQQKFLDHDYDTITPSNMQREPLTRAGVQPQWGRGQSGMMGRIPFEGQEGGVGGWERRNPITTGCLRLQFTPATRTPPLRAWSGAVPSKATLFSVVPAALIVENGHCIWFF